MRLELRGITKRFGSFTANDQISLTVEPGQIHCLLGENGAGKSTLMNVLFGLLHPDEGEVLIDGEPVRFSNSGEAVRRGIGMVHQHFMLVPVFSVAENDVLGFEPTKSFARLDHQRANEEIIKVSKAFNLEVDPEAIVALMDIMRSLAKAGKSILFITHKLKEVRAVSDVITIIRQGKVVGTAEPTASEAELASMMVGRDVNLNVEKSEYTP